MTLAIQPQHIHNVDPPAANPQTFNSPWLIAGVVERVTILWRDHSALQIAGMINREFGITLTRNSIMGKLSRLGLTSEHKTELEPRPKRHRRPKTPRSSKHRPKLHIVSNGAGTGLRIMQSFQTDPFEARVAPVESRQIDLLDLTDDTCRWPSESAPFSFCGHGPFEGSPYCVHHTRIAYRPWDERVRA